MVSRNYPTPLSHACHRCFKDNKLVAWIKEQATKGTCDWCGAKNAYVIEVTRLGEFFEPIVGLYHPSDSSRGDSLADLIRQDWEIFSDRIIEHDQGRGLVEAIMVTGVDPKELMASGIDYGGLFRSHNPYHSTLEDIWEEAAEWDLQFDPAESEGGIAENADEGNPDLHRISFAVEDRGTTYHSDFVLYRARIYKLRGQTERFDLDDMNAPPPDRTPAQRANRTGKPVLYMASDMGTALAEVRAWKGAPVCLAKMKTSRELRILDLRNPYLMESPFFHESLQWDLEAHALLNRFATELSRPVIPGEEEILYRPTQNICDLIERTGFDGIAYPSAMGGGHNVVLFDPTAAIPTEVTHHRVEAVTLRARNLNPNETPHDDVPWGN